MAKRSKREKLEDPLGIDEMSDDEFFEMLPMLEKKVIFEGIGSFLTGILFFILIFLLWDVIF